jgi:hypothetical protein
MRERCLLTAELKNVDEEHPVLQSALRQAQCIRHAVYSELAFRRAPKFSRMEAAGIEPASRDISATASTCVAGSFPHLALAPPTGRVRLEPAKNCF